MNTNSLVDKLQKEARDEFDVTFPLREGAYTFSGKRAKDFLKSLIQKAVLATLQDIEENLPGELPKYPTTKTSNYHKGWNNYHERILTLLHKKKLEVTE